MLFLLAQLKQQGEGYDENFSLIVRSNNFHEARFAANRVCGAEGKIWMNEELTSCKKIFSNGPAEVLCVNHKDG